MTTERPAEPEVQARETKNSLATALDAVFAPGRPQPADFVERLARFAAELTGARCLTVFGEDLDAPPLHTFGAGAQPDLERDLSKKALAEDRVAARPPFAMAVPVPTAHGRVVIAVDMPPGNQVLASLAFERLELLRAVCRERALGRAAALTEEALAAAAAVAMGDWRRAQDLADMLAAGAAGFTCSLVAADGPNRGEIVVSGQPNLAARATLPDDLRRRAADATKADAPLPGVRALGGAKPAYALIIDGAEDYLSAVAAPLSAIFAGGASRPSWRRRNGKLLRVTVVLALLAAAGLIPIGDGVNLPATVAPLNARIVTAPFDGRIAEVAVGAGDAATAGETVLLKMDRSELELALAEARAELASALTRRDSLRGRANAADRRDAEFTVRREKAKVDALAQKIALGDVIATIDGVVHGHDLAARQGAFVGLGGEIMRVIDPRALRIEAAITTRARARIAAGDAATFRADAAPNDPVPVRLDAIAVSPDAEGPDPIYLATTDVLQEAPGLRPGMRGVVRFRFDDAPLGLILWRRLRDWAIVTFWL